MANLTLYEDTLENCGLEETIMGSNHLISKMGINLYMIKFEDKIVITITLAIPYCVAVAIWFLKVALHRQWMTLRNLSGNILLISTELFLNNETSNLVSTVRSTPNTICYRVYCPKTKFASVHAKGCALRDMYRASFEILGQESDYQRCTSM